MNYPNIQSSFSLQTGKMMGVSHYDLHILNISLESTGLFICVGVKDGVVLRKTYEVLLKVKPSNIAIENMIHENMIQGTEGEPLKLTCSVTSGLPEENMTWYRGNTIVLQGGPRNITYSLTPKRVDNGQQVTCVVQSEALEAPLMKSGFLDIRYRPFPKFLEEDLKISEGDIFTIRCSSDSNPPANITYITKDCDVKAKCNAPTCKFKLKWLRHDGGIYSCKAGNEIGDGITSTTILILYPPVINVSMRNNTVFCNASGEPKSLTFLSWSHYSEQGKLLRSWNGSKFLELYSTYKRYLLNGLYVCRVSNGIRDIAGQIFTSGNCSVQVHGIPEVITATRHTQYGKFKESTTVIVFIYSVPILTEITLFRSDSLIDAKDRMKKTAERVHEKSSGNEIMIKGYKISLQISILNETDFTNYTFMFKNEKGSINCTISLAAEEVPFAPRIEYVTVEGTEIVVKFIQNFDGGSQQVTVVEFKLDDFQNWTRAAVINDTFGKTASYVIQDLDYDSEYCVQIYSVNAVGRSNYSEVCSLRTSAKTLALYLYVLFTTGSVSILIITTLVFRKGKKVGKWIVKKLNVQENNAVEDQLVQLGEAAVENQAYISVDSLPSMQPRLENGHADQNATSHSMTSTSENYNLNYAELQFNENTQRFHIHGEDRTIYSEVDHSLTAPPLESSDSEEENDDEDDFMSLEEIAEFMREKCLSQPFED